jgi:hypothetical protein
MPLIRLAFVILAAACVAGCATEANLVGDTRAKSTLYETAAANQPLAESLFKEDKAVISDEDMAKILAAKITIPPQAKLAVVRFGQLPYWWGWSEDFTRLNKQIDDDFLERLGSANHIREVSYLPSLVTPKEMTLPYLRQAAARFQADLLLVYRTTSQNYQRYKFFSEDETRAYCTVEAILLDTRSGIIPFSTVVTEDFSAKKQKSDLDFNETIAKASQQAIGKAWLHLADQVKTYLSRM